MNNLYERFNQILGLIYIKLKQIQLYDGFYENE